MIPCHKKPKAEYCDHAPASLLFHLPLDHTDVDPPSARCPQANERTWQR